MRMNLAFRNGVGGFYVFGSSFNTIAKNVACHNAELDALDDGTGVGNVWEANAFCRSSIP
jgi:parallel beta-helix repeat protein